MYRVKSLAQRVRISSIVLFFNRDCAGGAGPAVDAPSTDAPNAVEEAVGAGAVAVAVVLAVVAAG